MKILIVSPQFPSPAYPLGGYTISPQALLFHRAGHDVRIIVPIPWVVPIRGLRKSWTKLLRIPDKEEYCNIITLHPRFLPIPHFLYFHSFFYKCQQFFYQRALYNEVTTFLQEGGDIIHAHSCILAGKSLLNFPRDFKLVVSVHDNELQDVVLRNPVLRDSIIQTLTTADHVVYVSEKLRKLGYALVGPHSSSIIPWGVTRYPHITPHPPPSFTVVCVARFIATKGIAILIEAFSKLVALYPEVHLILVGNGPERHNLQQLVHHYGLTEHVTFFGYLPNRAAVQHIANATVFALPSYEEALGIAYFEAMSVGVPLIGVKGQGIEQFITHGVNGLLVPPHDAHELFLQLQFLLEHPTCAKQIGHEGQKTFSRYQLDWKGHVKKHLALYTQLLHGT